MQYPFDRLSHEIIGGQGFCRVLTVFLLHELGLLRLSWFRCTFERLLLLFLIDDRLSNRLDNLCRWLLGSLGELALRRSLHHLSCLTH